MFHRLKYLFLVIMIPWLVNGQGLFNEPRLSGTPLLPDTTAMRAWLVDLKTRQPEAYQKLSETFQKTSATLPDNVGDRHTFKVYNIKKSENNPVFDDVAATLRAREGAIRLWVQDSEWDNKHVTQQVLDDLVNDLLYQTPQGSVDPSRGIVAIDQWAFGDPPNVDGSGRVHFLLTDIQDSYNGQGSFVGGFFFSYDQTAQPGSNQADLLYIDTYPGIYNDKRSPEYDPGAVLGTVAHEYQHLIHYNYDVNEETWVNEGLSELASYLCGYGLRSPGAYLHNSDLSLIDWNDDDPLPHYARVALWSYFLYEKYGIGTVRAIAQNSLTGVNGVTDALAATGNPDLVDVLNRFFKTLISNDPVETPETSFDWPALQYVRAFYTERITRYPQNLSRRIAPYSLKLFEITNTDSLTIAYSSTYNGAVFYNLLNGDSSQWLMPLPDKFDDNNFGQHAHTMPLVFINTSGTGQTVDLDVDGHALYDLLTLEYGSDTPTFVIGSDGATNAMHFISPRDSSFIKNVSFYNYNSSGPVEVQVYHSALTQNSRPSFAHRRFENVADGGWVTLNVENIKRYVAAESFMDVGIYYPEEGTMGYETST
ncbi:MAG: hypothetical protein D6677_10275, partial [Calditrichaeota bacterium]